MLTRVVIAMRPTELGGRLCNILDSADCHVENFRAPGKGVAWERLSRRNGDLFIVSRDMLPNPVDESVRLLCRLPESPDVIVVFADSDNGEGAALIAAGASAVLESSLDDELIHDTCLSVIDRRKERIEVIPDVVDRPMLSDFETLSPRMRGFLSVVYKVVNSDSTLLVMGETGVGKEHLARAIHSESHRSAGPFVSVNCGALPEALLESELFGHEEGAFTGAHRARRGMFELAHNGTIFLDEIGEMATHLQVKLLQVLQTREVRRLGGDQPVKVDVRVIAATHRELLEEIEAKRFRLDLYYRLSVISLEIPALRERHEDVEKLVEQFLAQFRQRFARDVDYIEPDALAALKAYHWPGNIRELANIIERAMLLATSNVISLADLPDSLSPALDQKFPQANILRTALEQPTTELKTENPMNKTLAEVRKLAIENCEKEYLDQMLRLTDGRVGETAVRAGIQPRSLYEKMKRYSLRKEDYRYRSTKCNLGDAGE